MKVTFDRVTKRYGGPGGFVALKDLDLEVADGEFLVLVGPSGCGKTTALRCLAGLEDITGGRIAIGERVVNDLPPKDRDIAMVFQSYALYPHMSVYENLAFSLRLRKAAKEEVEKRVREAADILDLAHLLDRRPGQLSGGQRQRVALGRAIVREPAVFLMDEPLSNLDAKLRVATRAQIARLHRRLGTTIIYVTHDQVEAMTMGDRIAVMNLGVLQQVGSPSELYGQPRNRFVAGFIGSPSMNFLDGVVTVRGGSTAVRCADVTLGLSGRQAQVASSRGDGSEIVVGIRPEHLDVVPPSGGRPGLATFPASVDVVEFLGHENMIHVTAAEQDVVAVVSTDHRVQVGDRVSLGAPMDGIHLFDPQTGESLTANGGGATQQPAVAGSTSATPAE